VWRVSASDPAPRTWSLDAGEQARAARIVDARTRHRWTMARDALRVILASYARVDPKALRFSTTGYGKPSFTHGRGSEAGLEFSLSHSDDVTLIAVARAGAVGVDLERVTPLASDLRDIADRFLAADERPIADLVDARERLAAFYRCWTRKEAVLKAAGLGLHSALDEVSVEWAETARPRVRAAGPGLAPAGEWSLVHLEPGGGYVGALAAPWPIGPIQQYSWKR
jgi:4'-phosphopantetheinyl transferase